jgi:hypothetical protein
MRCLAKAPEERFASAADLADALEAAEIPPCMALVKPALAVRTERRRRPWVVMLAATLLLLAGACVTVWAWPRRIRESPATEHAGERQAAGSPLAALAEPGWLGPPAGQREAWKAPDRSPARAAPFVDVYRAKWRFTGAGVHTEDGHSYHRARRMPKDPCVYYDDACLLAFDLESKPDLPWVKVEEVKVVVTEYKPMTRYRTMAVWPSYRANLYYVEIDHPTASRTNVFLARYYEQGKPIGEWGFQHERSRPVPDVFVRLERGKPEAFLLRLSARTPGIYTLFCEVTVSSRDKASDQRVGETQTVFFE